MTNFIIDEGRKIIQSEAHLQDPLKFTDWLLKFEDESDLLIQNAFQHDVQFYRARSHAFRKFMCECDKTPHFIAFYIDFELKKGLN